MWRDNKTGVIVKSHSEIRMLRPQVSLPAIISDELIAANGFEPVVATVVPTCNPLTHKVTEKTVERINGVLTQGWDVVTYPQDVAAANITKAREEYLTLVRDLREKLLNRLNGIAFRADKAGDQATVTACITASQRLLDITTLPALLTATSQAELEDAVDTEYASIVSEAPNGVKQAFRKVDQ